MSKKNGFDPFESAIFTAIEKPNVVSELAGLNPIIRNKFFALTKMQSEAEVADFCTVYTKAEKYGNRRLIKWLEYVINMRVSIGKSAQSRADLIADIAAQVRTPRYEDGNSNGTNPQTTTAARR